ncbi:MAG: hypothetical protein GY906_00295 [bacterium]|nr:hypothetical protein [bacterium]
MRDRENSRPLWSLASLGFAAIAAQSILLREAMAATGGSELSWGIVLAIWLAGMGAGARVSVRWSFRSLAPCWYPILLLLLAAGGVVVLRAAPAVLGSAPGEIASVLSAFWLWVAAVIPASFSGGFAFPLLAEQLGPSRAGIAYAADSVGALVGGVGITFMLLATDAIAALCLTIGLVLAATLARRQVWLSALVIVVFAASSLPLSSLAANWSWRWSGRMGSLSHWHESAYQRLELSSGLPANLYGDGRLIASIPDPYRTEPRAHLLMLLHPEPTSVVALGCLADWSFASFLQHPSVQSLTLIETDPALPDVLPGWLGTHIGRDLDDSRIIVASQGPVRALDSIPDADLILLLDGDPVSLRANRTRTTGFFSRCRDRLRKGGILVLRSGVGDTYTAGSGGRLLEILIASLRSVFTNVRAIPGEDVLLLASDSDLSNALSLSKLESRWWDRDLRPEIFSPEMLELLLDPSRAPLLHSRIDATKAPLNTISSPTAVIVAAARTEGRTYSEALTLLTAIEKRSTLYLLVLLAATVLLLLALIPLRQTHSNVIAAVIGGSSMGHWIVLLAAWQATQGSVFAHVGALSACFMAGLAFGAFSSRWTRSPVRCVPLILGTAAVLTLATATGLPLLLPLPIIPALLLMAGMTTGSAFTGIAELAAGNDTRTGSAIAFAAEEVGAMIAALLVGLILLPCMGIHLTAAALALIQIAAIPMAYVSTRRP